MAPEHPRRWSQWAVDHTYSQATNWRIYRCEWVNGAYSNAPGHIEYEYVYDRITPRSEFRRVLQLVNTFPPYDGTLAQSLAAQNYNYAPGTGGGEIHQPLSTDKVVNEDEDGNGGENNDRVEGHDGGEQEEELEDDADGEEGGDEAPATNPVNIPFDYNRHGQTAQQPGTAFSGDSYSAISQSAPVYGLGQYAPMKNDEDGHRKHRKRRESTEIGFKSECRAMKPR